MNNRIILFILLLVGIYLAYNQVNNNQSAPELAEKHLHGGRNRSGGRGSARTRSGKSSRVKIQKTEASDTEVLSEAIEQAPNVALDFPCMGADFDFSAYILEVAVQMEKRRLAIHFPSWRRTRSTFGLLRHFHSRD